MFWPQGSKRRPNRCRLSYKNCNFNDVTAEEYRKELVHDAFINGLSSHTMRQHLLENHTLTLDQAFDIASSMGMAVEHSAGYFSGESFSTPPVEMTETRSMLDDERTSCSVTKRKVCNFCGKALYERHRCPALDAVCYSCGKRGHFSRVCRSQVLRSYKPTKPVVRCLY